MMSFAHPGLLWLLPLALAPLIVPAGRALPYSWLALMPRDRASDALRWVLRAAACLALAAVIVALAGPYRPEYRVERIGKGAEIVLVLDRSRSMDQGFAGGGSAQPPTGTGPEAIDDNNRRHH
jgi:mxaC protein